MLCSMVVKISPLLSRGHGYVVSLTTYLKNVVIPKYFLLMISFAIREFEKMYEWNGQFFHQLTKNNNFMQNFPEIYQYLECLDLECKNSKNVAQHYFNSWSIYKIWILLNVFLHFRLLYSKYGRDSCQGVYLPCKEVWQRRWPQEEVVLAAQRSTHVWWKKCREGKKKWFMITWQSKFGF